MPLCCHGSRVLVLNPQMERWQLGGIIVTQRVIVVIIVPSEARVIYLNLPREILWEIALVLCL